MIDFPATPSVGQNYSFNSRTWQWNGEGWGRVINASQIVSVFTVLDPINEVSITDMPSPITKTWTLLNYL